MSTVATAWKDATQACFDYLVGELDAEPGRKAFIGSELAIWQLNQWAFLINSGPEQVQAYGQQRPPKQWEGFGELVGHFESIEEAFELAGSVLDLLPKRDLSPNVHLFRVRNHPQLTAVLVNVDEEEQQDVVWRLAMSFTVIYLNDTA